MSFATESVRLRLIGLIFSIFFLTCNQSFADSNGKCLVALGEPLETASPDTASAMNLSYIPQKLGTSLSANIVYLHKKNPTFRHRITMKLKGHSSIFYGMATASEIMELTNQDNVISISIY